MIAPIRISATTFALAALLSLVSLLSGFAQAQTVTGYSYEADRIDTSTRTFSWRRVDTFFNSTQWYRSYTFEADEESCFEWSVSRTTLKRYRLGTQTSACSVTEFSTTVRVAPGASKSLYRQRVESETAYRLSKYAHYSDGTIRRVSTSYAYLDKRSENHRVR